MEELGADEKTIAQYTANFKCDDDFEVWPDNWDVVEWFLETDDLYRWNYRVCLGLDIAQVKADASMSGRTFTKAQYEDLRFISHIYADELTKQMGSSTCPTSLRGLN